MHVRREGERIALLKHYTMLHSICGLQIGQHSNRLLSFPCCVGKIHSWDYSGTGVKSERIPFAAIFSPFHSSDLICYCLFCHLVMTGGNFSIIFPRKLQMQFDAGVHFFPWAGIYSHTQTHTRTHSHACPQVKATT